MLTKLAVLLSLLLSYSEAQIESGLHVDALGHSEVVIDSAGMTSGLALIPNEKSFIIEKGTSLTLDCPSPLGRDTDVFLWHKHQSHPTYQVSHGDEHFLQRGHTFQIVNASSVHIGAYFCYTAGINETHKARKWKIADVNVVSDLSISPSPPPSTPKPKDPLDDSQPFIHFNLKSPVYLPESLATTLTLTPSVIGLDPMMLNWLRDSEVITQNVRLRISGDNGQQLEIGPPFSKDNSGFYEVKACNNNGCQSRGIQILFYSLEQQMLVQGKVLEEGELPAIIGGVVSGIIIYSVVMIVLKKKGIIFRNVGKEIEDGSRDIAEQMKRGLDGTSSYLWSWKEHSQMDREPSKTKSKKKRIINSMTSGVRKIVSGAATKDTKRTTRKNIDESAKSRSPPKLPAGSRPRSASSKPTPAGMTQTYGGEPHTDIYDTYTSGQHVVGPAADIYGTYGQFPGIMVAGGADIYGTVQPQMGTGMEMNIYGTYGGPAFQSYGNYGMHSGYGYGPTDEDIYGEAMYGSPIPPPPIPPPIGYAKPTDEMPEQDETDTE